MIIVNVRVPAIERVYNFSVEEKAPISDLIDEVTLLVFQKEGLAFEGDPKTAFREMSLFSLDNRIQLSRGCTLADYGVCDGTELMLV